MTENKRSHYRIEFPVGYRPQVTIQAETFEVIDLSEKGIRFIAESDVPWSSFKKPVDMLITFPDSSSVQVKGKILRQLGITIAASLTVPVPLTKIMELQRELIKKFDNPKNS